MNYDGLFVFIDDDDDDEFFTLPRYPVCPECGTSINDMEQQTLMCRKCHKAILPCMMPACYGYAYSSNIKDTKFECTSCKNTFAVCPFCKGYAYDAEVDNIPGYSYKCRICNSSVFAICNACGYYAYKYAKYKNNQKYKCVKKLCNPTNCFDKRLHFSDCRYIKTFLSVVGDSRPDCKRNSFYHMGGDCIPEKRNIPKDCNDGKCPIRYCNSTCGKQFTPLVEEKWKERTMKIEQAKVIRRKNPKQTYRNIASEILGSSNMKSTIHDWIHS